MTKRLLSGLILSSLAVHPAAARRVRGGIVNIDQSKLPFTISAPGSYRLTSNLQNGGTAIKVTTPNVTIDLNGFSIIGGQFGIDAGGQPLITILNGQVSGAFAAGITTGHSSRIEGVRVFGNGDGIDCTDGCKITDCIINNNTRYGIFLLDSDNNGRGVVSSNVIQYNGSAGVFAITATLVTGNSINNNGTGISFGTGRGGYSNNVLDSNGRDVFGGVNLGQNACGSSLCP
ncbi:MAG TPA: NosD domain-containing protein [Candidatus Binatia bacterium]|nr:NosD domain-containing protein [Candidatus Binatia bacterium]